MYLIKIYQPMKKGAQVSFGAPGITIAAHLAHKIAITFLVNSGGIAIRHLLGL